MSIYNPWINIKISPQPRSVTVTRGSLPPVFDLFSDHLRYCVIEVTTDHTLFDMRNSFRRNPPGAFNFFNSLEGQPGLNIPGQVFRDRRRSISLPPAIWSIFAQHPRIYYRLITAENYQGTKLLGQVTYTTTDQNYAKAPYIHSWLPSLNKYYIRSNPPTPRQLSWLMVNGNQVIEGRRSHPQAKPGPAVILRGINFSGLHYRRYDYNSPEGLSSQRWWEAAGITQARIREIASWGATIIRLPLNQDWVLNGDGIVGGKGGEEYLKNIDTIIDWVAAAGMYTLLDLQVLDSKNIQESETHPMPNNLSLIFWNILANRYRNDPAVLFDLCNEPHKPRIQEWPLYSGYLPQKDSGWVEEWHEWVRRLAHMIHVSHPDALLFVSGIGGPCFASSLRNMPVPSQSVSTRNPSYIPNAIYSAHIYYKKEDDKDGVDDSGENFGTRDRNHWYYWFGFEDLRLKFPIFIGEFGPIAKDFNPQYPNLSLSQQAQVEQEMLKWTSDLERYLRGLHKHDDRGQWQGLAGWTAWSWGDEPHIVERMQKGTYGRHQDRPFITIQTPWGQVHKLTEFGKLVKDALSR